jgi:GAF domain-containing protein
VSEEKKPILDEQTLAKVLEAAYVLQEYNRELQNKEPGAKLTKESLSAENSAAEKQTISSPEPQQSPQNLESHKADSTFTLAQIVEIQHQIQVEHLELESVMSLIAERMTRIAGASSAGIGILEGKNVQYRATAGSMALAAETEVPMEKALCFECLRTGAVFRCADVNTELLLDGNECRRRAIQSMIAVPVFHEGRVAGSLELYFPNPRAFAEEDVHACQLMGGLVSEALARNEKVSWKKSLATERAVMLEALEKLKPNLTALADRTAAKDLSVPARTSMAHSAPTVVCVKCGHELVGQEQFCGNCGLPRSSDYDPSNLQSTIATLWHMQEARKKTPPVPATNGTVVHEESQKNHIDAEESFADAVEGQVVEPYASAGLLRQPESAELLAAPEDIDFENSTAADLEIPPHTIPEDNVEALATTALAKPERPAAWSSAATARDFFEQLAAARNPGAWAKFWNARRGDIYLVVAVILVLVVIGWGIRSRHSVNATRSPAGSAAHRKAAADADLPLFDRILVKIGLAEAPGPPQYKGNPRTQVWVDLQTALYYCPGADLYGKTPKGKLSSQRDAQLDQFEPAYRKACD